MSADAILQRATQVRRELHRVPEICYEEVETAKVIRAELDRLGIDYAPGPERAPTATVAVLGDTSKPCVLLRADIDGLPITEATDAPHASQTDGRMHACGHDGHAANLLAVAATLQDETNDLPVCVKLVWQPAEEGGGGGKRLCDAGLLDDTAAMGPKVVAAFGLHGWPLLPLNTVSTKPGPLLAATDTFSITFRGTGGHAAMPHKTTDPLAAAAAAVTSCQQIAAREIDPTEPAVLSITQFHAGTARNVIAESATIAGTARTLTPETRVFVKQALHRRCEQAAEMGRCALEFDWHDGYPPTVNDPAMTEYATRVFRDTLGPGRFLPTARATMGGEDFSYYLERVPGCFYFIGLLPPGQNEYPQLHTDTFDFVDEALATGVSTMCELVRRFQV